MPVYNRRGLRQTLGRDYIRDMVSSTTGTFVAPATLGAAFGNPRFIDSGLAGQGLGVNTHIWHNAGGFDYRVSSMNTGSGQYVTGQFIEATIAVGDEFEVHSRLSASEKNAMIDETLKSIRVQQEVGIATGTAGADFFTIEGAASPHYISDVLDAYWFANPDGSLDRTLYRFTDIRLVMTGSGREIRVNPAPGGSAQLMLDAILTLTLGGSEGAAITIPDDTWLLAGAAARCYNLMIQAAPGQNAGELANRRTEWANQFSQLSTRFAPSYTRTVRLEEPEDANSPIGLLTW
jgi:hypothetical protein